MLRWCLGGHGSRSICSSSSSTAFRLGGGGKPIRLGHGTLPTSQTHLYFQTLRRRTFSARQKPELSDKSGTAEVLLSRTSTTGTPFFDTTNASSTSCRELFPNPLQHLRKFLCPGNGSPSPEMRTPHEIEHLYLSVKSRSELPLLGSDNMRTLLGIFGSLSLPHPRVKCKYVKEFVSHIKEEGKGRSYWSIALDVAKNMEGLGVTFTREDRYWIMMVHLASVKFNAPPELTNGVSGRLAQSLSHRVDGPAADWRATFALATLERLVESLDTYTTEVLEDIRNITRLLWRGWSHVNRDTHGLSPFVSRAIVTSFFRLAAVSRDIPLKDACFRYSVSNFLWAIKEGDERTGAQIRTLTVEYVSACVACGEKDWQRIFSTLGTIFNGTWLSDTARALIIHFTPREPNIAYQLFMFYPLESTQLSADLVHSLSMSLVSIKHLDLAIPFLQDPRFSPLQTRELLGAVLFLLAQPENHYIDAKLVALVCDVIHSSYTSSIPSSKFRWRIECLLLLAVTSGYPSRAIAIIRAIQHNSQSYFTAGFFFRLLRELLTRRQFRHATYLSDLVAEAQVGSVRAFRRALTFGLTKGGASTLAQRVSQSQIDRSTKESLARALDFRLQSPPRVLALRILPTLQRSPPHLPSIQYALHMLIQANRILSAKKLFERTQAEFDTQARTSLGNIVLHGALFQLSGRNGRRMRKVLSVLDDLVKNYAFVPDRITVNILLKALLRWTTAMDSKRLKALFDHMIRSGYPAGHISGVPFGTPLPSPGNILQLPNLPPFISFEKHIRPMYKMFVKAFHLRGDGQAAQVIIGILKAEAKAALKTKEIRSRARQEGRLRARK